MREHCREHDRKHPHQLLEIVYMSEPDQTLTDRDIIDILESSQENNEELCLTGVLFYDGRHFLQVLEGPNRSAWKIYSEILADPRHRNVVTIHEGPIHKRAFNQWGMAYRRIDPDSEILRLAREQLEEGEAVDPSIIHVGALIERANRAGKEFVWTARPRATTKPH